MNFSLSKVFSKQTDKDLWVFRDSGVIPFQLSKEAFYRYIFPKTEEQQLSVPQKLVIDVTLQSIAKKAYRSKSAPRLPHIIPRLLRSIRDPDSAARDYVEIINKDPVMASTVLKLANSVYFNPTGRRIHEIEQAVVKLGIHGLRTVLSAAVMQPIIQKDSPYFSKSGQRMWQHSLCCAIACESIAEHHRLDKFKVYILGLIHDIGQIALFSELCKQFKLNNERVEPGYNAFVPAIKKISHSLSYWIAKDWEMSPDICEALLEQTQLSDDQQISAYGFVLAQANFAAELFVSVYPKNAKKAIKALEELDLPSDLFDAFEQVQNEI